ncbi:hypothetical protein [Streptosporangium sp. NPDC002721]|uniref:hypothetical protein n=1 Tax=Streptosporangium sp. NPDC002721 TaxID=3366188 RepID=UPI00369B1482
MGDVDAMDHPRRPYDGTSQGSAGHARTRTRQEFRAKRQIRIRKRSRRSAQVVLDLRSPSGRLLPY